MQCQGREVRSRTDYHLGTDRRLFQNVSVQDPQNSSENYMVLGFLHGAAHREHCHYLGQSWRSPLNLPITQTWEDRWFEDLRRAIPKISPRARRRNERISAELWRLSDTRMAVQREPQRNQCLIRDLGRKARVVLKVDRQLLAETAGMEVEALLLLDPPPAKEACIRIQGWYHGVEERAPPQKGIPLSGWPRRG